MLPFYANPRNPTGEMLRMLIDSIDLTPTPRNFAHLRRVGAVPSVTADVPTDRPMGGICRPGGAVSVQRGDGVGRTTTMP